MPAFSFVACHSTELISNGRIFCAQLLDQQQPARRCRNKIRGENIPELERLWDDIDRTTIRGTDRSSRRTLNQLAPLLRRVGELTLCGQHHRRNVEHAVQQWLRDFGSGANERPSVGNENASLTRYSTRTDQLATETRSHPARTETRSTTAARAQNGGRRPLPLEQTELTFVPVGSERAGSIADRKNAILSKLHQSLTPQDMSSGHIYVLWLPHKPGMYKIGFSKNPERRFDTHRTCYPDIEKGFVTPEVNHVHRVEQLIFKELAPRHRRLGDPCSACRQRHMEWFEVDAARIKKTVKRWVAFFEEMDPYTSEGLLKTRYRYVLPILGLGVLTEGRWREWLAEQRALIGTARTWTMPSPPRDNIFRTAGIGLNRSVDGPSSAADLVLQYRHRSVREAQAVTHVYTNPGRRAINTRIDATVPELLRAIAAELDNILDTNIYHSHHSGRRNHIPQLRGIASSPIDAPA